MITLTDYYMGRDRLYPDELTAEVIANARITIERVNALLRRAESDGIVVPVNPGTGCCVNSGWRPAAVNAAIPGAARRSRHMTGEACDLNDPDGVLDQWCLANEAVLQELGLWLEHPDATDGWCHVQCVPYRSWYPGKPRWFEP